MIYQPQPFFNVMLAVNQGFIAALARAAVDYIVGEGEPWAYYLGYGLGGSALATGIPGAQATLYAVGAGTAKIILETGPGRAEVTAFLDGVAQANINLDDEVIDFVEYTFNIPNDSLNHTMSLLNLGTPPMSLNNPDNWLSILGIETVGTVLEEKIEMAYNTIVFRIKDSETDTTESSFPVNVPTGLTLAEYQAYATAVAPEVDAVSGGQIVEATLSVALTLPGGLKASPDSGVYNERGGLITFDTAGPRADSVRIPAIKPAIMSGDSFSLAQSDVAALITRLTTATTAANIRPVSAQGYNFVAARKGSKSQRKRA